jgi:hypothetical protein
MIHAKKENIWDGCGVPSVGSIVGINTTIKKMIVKKYTAENNGSKIYLELESYDGEVARRSVKKVFPHKKFNLDFDGSCVCEVV